MSKDTKNTQVAVFFDYENIVYSLRNRFEQKANFEAIIDKCKEFGRLSVAKAFADWGLPYMSPALMYALQSSGFELVFVPTGSTQSNSPRKNVADLYMAISVMDVLHTRPEIETFILLTGDRDFMLLVNHLKQRGKRVVAIGVDGSSSYYLTQAVDDFFYYSEVEEIFEYQPKRQKGRPTNIYDALQQAVQVMREKGRSPRLTNLKPVMVELMGNFDEKSYTDSKGRNFQKFKDFVQEAQRRGTVRLLRRGNVIEVHLPKENIDSLKQLPPVEDIDDDAIDLELAYKLLLKAATEVAKKNKSLRVGMVRNRMKRMLTTFDAARVQNEEGDFPFAKFIGFIKAAEKAGVISIKGSGSRMELVLVDKAPEFDETEGEDENGTLEIGEISDVTPIAGDKAREAVLTAIRAYKNYPTSFLSLAGFVHRHNETLGVVIDEVEARDLMTEAVKGDLLHQIVLKDGRRQYELNDSAEIIAKFLGQEDVSEVETIEDIPEEENAEEETPTSPTFATPYEGLVEAVRVILQDGKDPVLPRVKSTMVNLMGSFSEKEYSDDKGVNFTKFKEFVTDAEARGYVRMQVDGMINRVFLPDSEQTKTPEPETNTEQLPVTKPIHVQPPVVETVEETEEAATSLTDEVVTSEEIDEIAEAIAEMGIMFEDAATANKTESVKESAENAVAISEPIKVEEEQPTVGEPEQRKIVVEGLRTFGAYPAPFMGILAHCRKVRTKHGVTVTSADLRDLLSETVRIGLVKPAPNQKRRPTLYTYSADEALAERYISQEYSDESVAATPSEATAASTVTAPIVTKPEIVSAPVEEVEIAPVIKTDSETDDAPVRQLIIDVLGAWEGYPSTFADLLAEIKKAQAEKGFVVSDSRLRKLLNITTRKGVLVITSPRGIRPTRYAHTGDASAVEAYIGTPAPVVAEPVVEEVAVAETPTVTPEQSEAVAIVDTSDLPEEVAAFIEAVQQLEAAGKTTTLGSVKKQMKKLLKGFDEKKYTNADGKPFKRFREFAQETVVKRGLVELVHAGKTKRAVLVTPQSAAAKKAEASPEQQQLEQAFALLVKTVADATNAKASLRLPGIRTRMLKEDPTLDFSKLKNPKNNRGFRGITMFVRAAERAGHVVVSGKGIAIEVRLPS